MKKIFISVIALSLSACATVKDYEICDTPDCTSPDTTVVIEA